jgi:DNA (cytosine-5)-methyltransferase 1
VIALDVYACQGGAGEGYLRAGFSRVVSVDVDDQPRNPHEFHRADALEVLRELAESGEVLGVRPAFVHASPPCQLFSVATKAWNGRIKRAEHQELVTPTRELLREWGGAYVIENVPGAPLENAVQLCGSSFGLAVRRHRLFESNVPLMALPCAHHLQQERKYPPTRSDRTNLSPVVSVFGAGGGRAKNAALWAEAMRIDWMDKAGLAQAIPPDYTEFLGLQVLEHLAREAA